MFQERVFTDCLDEAIKQTGGAKVMTELGFPYKRTSYYKLLHENPVRSCMRVFFNTSSGPRYVAVRLAGTTKCDLGEKRPVVSSSCPMGYPCPFHLDDYVRDAARMLESLYGIRESDFKENDAPNHVNSASTQTLKENTSKVKPGDSAVKKKGDKKEASPDEMKKKVNKTEVAKQKVTQTEDTLKKPTALANTKEKHTQVHTEPRVTPGGDAKPRVASKDTQQTKGVKKGSQLDSLVKDDSLVTLKYNSSSSIPLRPPISKPVPKAEKAKTTAPRKETPKTVAKDRQGSPTHSMASSGSATPSTDKPRKLRKCHFCERIEPQPKTFKKCNK